MDQIQRAYALLQDWKGSSYVHGLGVLEQVGALASQYGKRVLVVGNTTYLKPVTEAVVASLEKVGCTLAGSVVAPDAKPNAPREDV